MLGVIMASTICLALESAKLDKDSPEYKVSRRCIA
jgi:hypothetical protein